MNNLFIYLFELNLVMVVFFLAYKLLFERDRNFTIRRIYLAGGLLLTSMIPLIPSLREISPVQGAIVTVHLEELTVFGRDPGVQTPSSFSWTRLLGLIYLGVVIMGILRLLIQLGSVTAAVYRSEKRMINGTSFLSSRKLHASSFFGYIFIDQELTSEQSFLHIMEHERIHKNQWHSVDRILAELFVMMNWFNPVAWMLRRAVIENLEFLADSAMLRNGTDPVKYQLSILNQYIGSASINNQFSSQIKKRIIMLNKNYKPGSGWKLTILFPIVALALIIAACTESEDAPSILSDQTEEVMKADPAPTVDGELFYVVEEMPTFQGGEALDFRKYIAQNIRYPDEAKENGVTGKVFIQFVVTSEGTVVIPDDQTLARLQGKSVEEVVVVTYRTMEEGQVVPEERFIQMLKDEVIRVVSSSPDWEPGRQRGHAVNVAFTFPVSFAMQ